MEILTSSRMTASKVTAMQVLRGNVATKANGTGAAGAINRPYCNACQNYGHQHRTTSKLCPKNKKSQYYDGTTDIVLSMIVYVTLLCKQADPY